MSLLARIALVEDRSEASNPGRISVEWLRYATHFPLWPACLAAGLVGSVVWVAVRPSFWPIPVLALALNLWYWHRVRLRFRFGCVNASKVVSMKPFMLAVFTDLTTGEDQPPYPVIKILAHPFPRGSHYGIGDKCATVAMYTGSAEAEHWEGFDPVMVDCATSDNSAIEHLIQTIPTEEWSELEAGLKNLPQPLKQGTYPLNRGGAGRS